MLVTMLAVVGMILLTNFLSALVSRVVLQGGFGLSPKRSLYWWLHVPLTLAILALAWQMLIASARSSVG
jgi:hypothetical protein